MKSEIERPELREYLLGTLDRDHKTQFEERILTEPDIYEELLVVEEELNDQYVTGELSPLEQQQFETHFLITAERQKNLRFGKLLQKYASSHADLTEHAGPFTVTGAKLSSLLDSGADEFIDNKFCPAVE